MGMMREVISVIIEASIGALARLGVLSPGENREGPHVGPEPDMVGCGKGDGLQNDCPDPK